MVAHIKSQRLVAFIIYSSLSIYASTGKKRIHYSNVVDRERNQSEIQKLLRRCCCLGGFLRRRRSRKIMLLGFMLFSRCLYEERMFFRSRLIYRTFTFLFIRNIKCLFTDRFLDALMNFELLFRKTSSSKPPKEKETCFC